MAILGIYVRFLGCKFHLLTFWLLMNIFKQPWSNDGSNCASNHINQYHIGCHPWYIWCIYVAWKFLAIHSSYCSRLYRGERCGCESMRFRVGDRCVSQCSADPQTNLLRASWCHWSPIKRQRGLNLTKSWLYASMTPLAAVISIFWISLDMS